MTADRATRLRDQMAGMLASAAFMPLPADVYLGLVIA